MKIKYLGTAAAEGIPALFCNCERCAEARKRKNKDIRSRSQALIDDKLLIDFPPDTWMHCAMYGLDFNNIDSCIITHTHSDHLYVNDFGSRSKWCSNYPEDKTLTFYSLKGTTDKINSYMDTIPDVKKYIRTTDMELFKPIKVNNYLVTPLEAIHDKNSFPMILLIEDDKGKILLYAHDTEPFSEATWEYLRNLNKVTAFVSIDCCAACNEEFCGGHMNLWDNIKVKEKMIETGCADDKTIFCCNHFSHNGQKVLYDDFDIEAKRYGFCTAYDGMVLNF